ncbi:uncharacterized protein Exn isoform X3 [Macrobrachium rosenbergii]|uniref:uncharacterized protein Exn isoform X3 n=1 Tax=Macrobrachium rosenbergii TaxID=79674 RepID=UPI0034D717AB
MWLAIVKGCEDGWGGIRAQSALPLPRQIVRPNFVTSLSLRRASLAPVGTAMPSSSREKSPRVSKVFAKISSDSKLQRNHEEEQKDESKDGSSASPVKSPEGKDAAESVKPKKTKRSILPYFRSHKNGKKGEKEKEKLKKEKGGDKDSNGKDALSSASPNKETDAQLPQVAETPEAEAPELVTKDADVLSPKELAESECVSTSDVTEVTDCISQVSTDFSERASEPFQGIPENEDLDFRPYSALHTSQTPIYETPIRMPQNYQKSFLHNRYGSNSSVETLPGRFDRIPSGSSSISSISSFSALAALRSRTLEPVSRRTQDPLGSQMPITYTRCSTLDTVRARFQNNVTNLTYEGVDFSSGPQSLNTSSTWSLSSKGFTSPFSKFSLNSSESSKASSKEKEKKSKGTAESKVTAKSGVKKILLNNRLKEETISETSPERKPLITELPSESKLKVEPVKSNQDSITIISNKNVRAKLNITVVKTPELTRKNLGSFRFARTGIRSSVRSSQKKRKNPRSPQSSSPPPSLTPTSPTSVRLKPLLKTIDGKIIPEYAKVNKRKNSKADIVDEDGGEKVLPLLTHAHESPAEKAPVVKKIEAAAHKGRKDLEPSVKVNPVKRAESFKGPSRVCRRSSFTYANRAKVFKEGLDPDSFVKSQAIKLRRKDSKNGRFDMKNARKAEYRLSVTIKPSTVATLTNKFNTMISQNQAGNPIGKAELPVGHVSLHETRVTRSPKPNVRFKNRTKMGRNYSGTKEKFKEGACLMDEKSIKEEKNREEKRGDLSVPGARKTNPRTSRSPSPKKTPGKNGACLLEKLGDNKTDEEKVCEKIKTALSSAKFKGETDDSEDDVVDQETNGETKYKVRVPSSSTSPANSNDTGGDTSQSSSAVPAVPVAGVSSTSSKSPASESTIPKIMKSPGKPPSNNLRDILAKISERNVNHYTEIDEVYPLPERHAKSDSMDSGISTEGELLSGAGSISIGNATLIISSVPSFPVCSQDQEDSSLDTVKSTETAKSEDSAVAFQDIVRSEDIMDQAEETILDSNMDEVSVVSSEEKGIIDVLETEGKGVDGSTDGSESEEKALKDASAVSQSEVAPESKDTDDLSECASPKTVQENVVVEEDLEEKIIEPDTRSVTSSCMDDTHSEVSSVCSEAKSKKPGKGHESRIYSAVKAAVKNTVKKTKEKDAERKEEKDKEKRNRSPSADREKWYRRGRSKERRQDKKKEEKDQEGTEEQDRCEEDVNRGDEKAESPKKEAKEREGRTYERFTFKKLREKSQERRRFKEKTKEEEEKRKEEEKKNAEDTKKDAKNKKKEEKSKEDSTYGKFTIGSRSRSRDRKKIKEKILDQLSIEPIDIKDSQEVSPSPKTADSLKQQESPAAAASVKEKENSTGTLPFLNRNKNENLVFTFDTESIYDKPLTPKVNMKSKTLPPPPKTPIPSPPSSATPLPPPPNTPIPDPPIESEKDRDSLEASLLSKDSDDHCNGDSDSSNETENIYENLYSPNMEKLHRNREKLEGRGIKPNNSFLWSDGVPPTPAITEPPKTEPISEESECERSPFTRLIGVKTYGKTNRYGKISPSSKSKDSGADGHNYAELQPTSEDTQTIAYDDIGAVSAVSYDDISAPSSCGYDDIGTSSSTGYDTIKPPSEGYDPVNPPRSDSSQYDDCDGGIVTAQLAVVREDQLDSISYMYDEISMYNASQNSHSYEPVYPPGVSPQGRPGVSIIEEVPETDNSTPAPTPTASTIPNTKEPKGDYNNESSDGSEDESEDGVHEVFSYKLTRIAGGLDAAPSTSLAPTTPTTPSTPGSTMHARIYGSALPPPLSFCPGVGCEANLSGGGGGSGDPAPSPSLSPTEGKSETSDEWMDVSDTETDTSTGPPISIVTQIPLVRMRQRSKRYRHHRNWRRSWSQGVRDVAAHMQAHAHHHHHHQSHAHTIGHHHEHHHHRYHHHHHHHHHHHAHGSSSSSSSAARGESGRDYSWRDGGAEFGMLRRPSHASSVSSRASTSSSASSFSSASSSSSSTSSKYSRSSSAGRPPIPTPDEGSCAAYAVSPTTPTHEEGADDEDSQVYVTSSSTIVLGQSEPNTYDTAYSPGYYNASLLSGASTNSSLYYESAKIRSIFYEGDDNEAQEISLYVEGGDSDDEDNATGHYEAIYEVISPAEDGHQCDEQDSDDSFESDDSNDAYTRLRPQFPDDGSQTSRDQAESLSSEVSASEKLQLKLQSPLQQQQQQEQQQQNQQQQQRSITKFAEAANLGMRRLRRNWSQTKDEVKTGLSRIKKKSTFSVSDMKSTENLACDLTPNLTPTSADNKRKWSFRSHFRRKSLAGSVTTVVSRGGGPPSKKESATFYLTLTIETERQDAGEMSDASQQTVRSDSESVLSSASTQEYRKSNTPSIASMTTVGSSSETTVPLRQHRPTSIIHHRKSTASCSYAPVRPRTAPPAPPPKEKDHEPTTGDSEVDEHSKTSVALRLNQLLSSGPTAPPGRRVLRTSEGSSSDTSPVPVLVHPDDGGYTTLRINSVKYATINMNNSSSIAEDSSGDEKALSPEVTSSVMHNVPQTRTSVVSASSHGSSEGYIRPCDIASAPPPLPARRTPVTHQPRFRLPPPSRLSLSQPMLVQMPSSLPDGDNNSYLDFSCDALNQEEPLYVSSHFADEPLYQFYTAKLLERAAQSQGDCSSEDDYEVINDGQHSIGGKLQTRPTAMELVTPADGRRTLWCELPEVIESGLLSQISTQEKKTQEAMFEMITSEASYLKSLNVLVTHFVQCPEFTVDEGDDAVLSRRERHILFSDILPVKRCSELFLADLEKRWQESVRISKISDIILKHANNHFQVYVKYCSNQIYQDRILKELKENNPKFLEVLNRLESSPVCQSLAMHSFLMLPMQRITRLPLLVDAIFHRLKHDTPEWEECKAALATLTKIVAECNEGARKMERMEEMLILSRQLDFREVKAIPLISASRWLVKKGELTRLTWKENDKLTFGKRISKHTLYFFLFTDLLVVTKKKSEDQYMVLDYCSRNMVQVLELDATDKFPGRILDGHKNLLIMTMLQNHENKTVEMVVSCPMESDRTRWVEAVTPRTSENPDERIYEEWDCPQVQAIHPYVAKESDELSLEVSDVVNVLKKMSDDVILMTIAEEIQSTAM